MVEETRVRRFWAQVREAFSSPYARKAIIQVASFLGGLLCSRGLVFGNLRRKSAAVGYIVSCLLFALLHVWQFAVVNRDITYFLLMLQYLVPGLVLAWVYDRTGTLWTSIGLHAAANALSAWTIVA